jgi:hypothetical protein
VKLLVYLEENPISNDTSCGAKDSVDDIFILKATPLAAAKTPKQKFTHYIWKVIHAYIHRD